MVTLNLTEGFNPYMIPIEDQIDFEFFTFKGGEPHIKLKTGWDLGEDILITIRIESFNDLGKLMIAVYAIHQAGSYGNVELVLPYFPGARQDRVMVTGEALTVKMYADLINDLNIFNTITIIDPHSDVAPSLINNCNIVDNHSFIEKVLEDIYMFDPSERDIFIVSPDAGANKKSNKLMQYLYNRDSSFNKIDLLKCDKSRDVNTGSITNFEVYSEDLEGRDCIIVDDICDGGGTFIGLAQELEKKNCGTLYLAVTHGIFSKGFEGLLGYFNEVYCTNSFNPFIYFDNPSITGLRGRIKVINLTL